MNNRLKRELAGLRTVKQFVADHPLTPANPVVTTEVAGVSTAITDMEELAEDQMGGNGTYSGAVDGRLVTAKNLLDLMSSLAKVAKTLDKETHPDAASKMQMGGIKSFEDLTTRANLFVSTLDPIKAEFIAMGASNTVVEDLQALIDDLQDVGNLKLTGLDTQIGGTRGLAITMRKAKKHVRKLDAVFCQIYRTNPVLLAQWKAARHVERNPVRATASSGDGSGVPAGGGDSGSSGSGS